MRFGYAYNYFISHPDYVHEVLVTQAASFQKDKFIKNSLGAFIGEGLTVNEGEPWRRQRKLVQPAFHSQRIARYADVMVQRAEQLLSRWEDGAARDIGQDMLNLTTGITSTTLFDLDISAQSSDLLTLLDQLQTLAWARNKMPPMPLWLPTSHNAQVKAVVQGIDNLVLQMVRERQNAGSEDRGDLLSMLLLSEDEDGTRLTEKQVRDQAVTLFVAGNDTTYNALMWLWYCLAQNPAVAAKLRAELDAVLGGRAPTLADLGRLPYTDMVVKETLRLYPPAWAFVREAIAPVTIGDVPIQKGVIVTVSPYTMHRDPRFWDAPLEFRPERFAPEAEAQRHKYAYFPFGGGPRVCIGNQFAMMELRLILATLAQHVTLELAPGHIVEPEPNISLRPRYGMKMVVHAREKVLL
jgi:cytochrome P450